MAGTDIFISYKREELALAEAYANAFRAKDMLVVTDLNLPEGERFGKAIDTMINEATLVVVLWTPASVLSEWVQTEAVEAHIQNKYFGVLAKQLQPDTLPFEVRHTQFIDVSDKSQNVAINTICTRVEARLKDERGKAIAANSPEDKLAQDMEFYSTINGVGDLQGYEAYLHRYPAGVYREEAQAKKLSIAKTKEDQRDIAFYDDVNNIGELSGYRLYLERFSTGIFRKEAQAKLLWINRFRSVVWSTNALFGTVFGGVAAFAAIYAIMVSDAPDQLQTLIEPDSTMVVELAGSQKEVQRLTEQQEQMSTKLAALEEERPVLLDARVKLTSALNTSQKEVQRLTEQQEQMSTKLAALEEERPVLLDARVKLTSALNTSQKKVQRLTEQQERMRTTLATIAEQQTLLSEARKNSTSALDASQKEVQRLTEQQEQMSTKLAALEEELTVLFDVRVKLTSALEASQKDVQRLTVQLADLRSNEPNMDLGDTMDILDLHVSSNSTSIARCAHLTLGKLCIPKSNPSLGAIPCSSEYLGEVCLPVLNVDKVQGSKRSLEPNMDLGDTMDILDLHVSSNSTSIARCAHLTLGKLCIPKSNPSLGAIPCSSEYLGESCLP